MENIGIVKKIEGSEAIVEIQRTSACGESCASCKGGCIPTKKYVEAINLPEAKAGQRVKIELQTKKVLNAAIIMYLLPLLSTFIGVLLGIWAGGNMGDGSNQEAVGIATGLIFLGLSFLGIRLWDRSRKNREKVEIVISKIIK
ncbi:SoxR reducing system RseC family protein [Isachenkonia alkalipeptolytica]|uniref:Sigma E positive regulator RseC/MucC n=1 Tax=Isachenkonia alkalipeptolytica TaxID=2565777 RepID=A0AA43XM11_9CLOT|nr:SoxR reducing system RseC family protein [Isachenkonia alkalipeptolytica]NBG88836.1 sigma E positive regulator RseC/MucC [Isachenkonia alkalipeptolytica]